jgi:hypothetical protein
MYEPFYNLSRKPFQLSPDPSFYYDNPVQVAGAHPMSTHLDADDLLRAVAGAFGLYLLFRS